MKRGHIDQIYEGIMGLSQRGLYIIVMIDASAFTTGI